MKFRAAESLTHIPARTLSTGTGPQATEFPLKVAAIDVGSNAIRFVAAEFAAPLQYRVLAQQRAAVRLGHEVFRTGSLAPAALDAAVQALAGFRARMDAAGIRHYRAVATSATREARNRAVLVDRARAEAGIELEVITGSEEARLGFEAIRGRVPLGEDAWILVDLGGGSVEVSLATEAGIIWSESHVMGSVRLLEELEAELQEPGRMERLLREYAATLQIPVIAQQWKPRGVIATGGNIEALARLAGRDPRGETLVRLPLEELQRTVAVLGRMDYQERQDRLGLRADRADVILPAALIYERVAVAVGASEIVVPAVGLKDGLLIDLADELVAGQAHADRKERQAMAGALALGRRYLFDEAHGAHVARLAGSLFDQLAGLHGMTAADRRMLLAAAVLHDIGVFVGYRRHHKHSLYLISQSELPEFAPAEIDIIANVARYHRKGVPAPHHEPFNRLPPADRERVFKLASLLRLADALDREHIQAVTAVRATRADRRVVLLLRGTGDLLLERWALRQKANLFQEIFGMRVETADHG